MNPGAVLVSSDEVAEYTALVERVARRYDGVRGAELEDLVQEGRIAVWLALSDGDVPDEDDIKDRVRNWVKFVSREGMGGFDEPLHYEI